MVHWAIECILRSGFLVEKSMFFVDSQQTHYRMMPIFDSIRGIPPTDLVSKFERNLLSRSQVIMHTNTKEKKAKTDTAKINTFCKTLFWSVNKPQKYREILVLGLSPHHPQKV